MSMIFGVRVCDHRGQPQPEVRVTADFSLYCVQMTEATDNDGWAIFKTTEFYPQVEISIGSVSYGERALTDGGVFFVTLKRAKNPTLA